MPKNDKIKGLTSEIAGAHWNFEPCKARHVQVIVGKSPRNTWWCAALEGQERAAIEVEYHGTKFYIDDNTEGLEKLLVRRRLFQGIQLAAVQVLQEGIAQQVVIGGVTDDGRNGLQPCRLDRPPTALTHDQFIGFTTRFG